MVPTALPAVTGPGSRLPVPVLFFTRAWATGELSTEESEAVLARYEQHLEQITPRLPATVRVLARELNLFDARIRRARLDRAGRELRLELRCGDERVGHYDLDLAYLGAIVDAADAAVLERAARDPEAAVWFDEVDVADGDAFLHRILFRPGAECEVLFRALSLRMAPRGAPELPGHVDRWVEGPR